MNKIDSRNNFDLLRLFAATQVAIGHATGHLEHSIPILSWIVALPGVPIFFFLSGLLIYGSYISSLSSETPLTTFYTKRALRLYPGLWACFIVSALLVWFSGYLEENFPSNLELLVWIGTQTTFFQFYNPEFLRAFGVGALNGALWTIAVELQFYVLFPLVHRLLQSSFFLVLAALCTFIVLNQMNIYLNPKENIFEKLFNVSFIPWIYMFLFGAMTAHYVRLRTFMLRTNFFFVAFLFVTVYFFSEYLGLRWENGINPIGFGLIAIICFRLGFRRAHISDALINKNDVSYGVYIYHMPIINLILYLFGTGSWQFYVSIIATFLCAVTSWTIVEKPSLRRKLHAARTN